MFQVEEIVCVKVGKGIRECFRVGINKQMFNIDEDKDCIIYLY